jgi:hypothetical protein
VDFKKILTDKIRKIINWNDGDEIEIQLSALSKDFAFAQCHHNATA